MKKFIRYFNQNRIKVIITIFIIVFIIVLIYTVNGLLGQINENMTSDDNIIIDESFPSESVITGDSVSQEVTEKNVQIIEQFVEYCNNKDYENAYNLLTDDCKSEIYETVDVFQTSYCDSIFDTKKSYSLELLYYTNDSYTYSITYTEDNMLSTGIVNSSKNKQDYITLVETENGDKLNISSFIGKESINKTSEVNGIKIEVIDRFRYRTYERYSIRIENNTDKTILLSEGTNSNDICLVDSNDVEYNSMLNEIPATSLEIPAHTNRSLSISFYKNYNLYRTIESIRFKNIISDLDAYEIDSNITRTIINIDI